MATAIAQIRTAGGTVRFDVDDPLAVGPERVSRKGEAIVAELDQSLEQALETARPAALAVRDVFRSLSPDRVSIEFGLRLDASAGAVIAKAGVGAHFTVTLDWDPSSQQSTHPTITP